VNPRVNPGQGSRLSDNPFQQLNWQQLNNVVKPTLRWEFSMKNFLVLTLLLTPVLAPAIHAQPAAKGSLMSHHATGSFEPVVKPLPPDFPDAPALGRMTINKQLHGGIEGNSTGQMLTAMSETKGSAGYVAVELVTGKVDGRAGSFSLIHLGLMDRGKPTLTVTVVPDSGTGELVGLTGTFTINITADGKHTYDFEYTLPTKP
jgi:hypothetical protein